MKKTQSLKALYGAIVAIENESEAKAFLEDLLSAKELESLSSRVASAQLFMQGKTYKEVMEETTVSSATLARVNKCVKQGKGYSKILTRMAKKSAATKEN